jgi:hypothetical protein
MENIRTSLQNKHLSGNGSLGFGSAGSEFTGVLARSLPTCRRVGSEFTNLQPLMFGTKYRIEEPNKNQDTRSSTNGITKHKEARFVMHLPQTAFKFLNYF